MFVAAVNGRKDETGGVCSMSLKSRRRPTEPEGTSAHVRDFTSQNQFEALREKEERRFSGSEVNSVLSGRCRIGGSAAMAGTNSDVISNKGIAKGRYGGGRSESMSRHSSKEQHCLPGKGGRRLRSDSSEIHRPESPTAGGGLRSPPSQNPRVQSNHGSPLKSGASQPLKEQNYFHHSSIASSTAPSTQPLSQEKWLSRSSESHFTSENSGRGAPAMGGSLAKSTAMEVVGESHRSRGIPRPHSAHLEANKKCTSQEYGSRGSEGRLVTSGVVVTSDEELETAVNNPSTLIKPDQWHSRGRSVTSDSAPDYSVDQGSHRISQAIQSAGTKAFKQRKRRTSSEVARGKISDLRLSSVSAVVALRQTGMVKREVSSCLPNRDTRDSSSRGRGRRSPPRPELTLSSSSSLSGKERRELAGTGSGLPGKANTSGSSGGSSVPYLTDRTEHSFTEGQHYSKSKPAPLTTNHLTLENIQLPNRHVPWRYASPQSEQNLLFRPSSPSNRSVHSTSHPVHQFRYQSTLRAVGGETTNNGHLSATATGAAQPRSFRSNFASTTTTSLNRRLAAAGHLATGGAHISAATSEANVSPCISGDRGGCSGRSQTLSSDANVGGVTQTSSLRCSSPTTNYQSRRPSPLIMLPSVSAGASSVAKNSAGPAGQRQMRPLEESVPSIGFTAPKVQCGGAAVGGSTSEESGGSVRSRRRGVRSRQCMATASSASSSSSSSPSSLATTNAEGNCREQRSISTTNADTDLKRREKGGSFEKLDKAVAAAASVSSEAFRLRRPNLPCSPTAGGCVRGGPVLGSKESRESFPAMQRLVPQASRKTTGASISARFVKFGERGTTSSGILGHRREVSPTPGGPQSPEYSTMGAVVAAAAPPEGAGLSRGTTSRRRSQSLRRLPGPSGLSVTGRVRPQHVSSTNRSWDGTSLTSLSELRRASIDRHRRASDAMVVHRLESGSQNTDRLPRWTQENQSDNNEDTSKVNMAKAPSCLTRRNIELKEAAAGASEKRIVELEKDINLMSDALRKLAYENMTLQAAKSQLEKKVAVLEGHLERDDEIIKNMKNQFALAAALLEGNWSGPSADKPAQFGVWWETCRNQLLQIIKPSSRVINSSTINKICAALREVLADRVTSKGIGTQRGSCQAEKAEVEGVEAPKGSPHATGNRPSCRREGHATLRVANPPSADSALQSVEGDRSTIAAEDQLLTFEKSDPLTDSASAYNTSQKVSEAGDLQDCWASSRYDPALTSERSADSLQHRRFPPTDCGPLNNGCCDKENYAAFRHGASRDSSGRSIRGAQSEGAEEAQLSFEGEHFSLDCSESPQAVKCTRYSPSRLRQGERALADDPPFPATQEEGQQKKQQQQASLSDSHPHSASSLSSSTSSIASGAPLSSRKKKPPPFIPPLGLTANAVGCGSWMSGSATQGDCYPQLDRCTQ